MKFDVVLGNPPYQDGRKQIYADFYLASRDIANKVSLIFPMGWQEPKTANGLSKLNNKSIKQDPHIVYIENIQNAFPGVSGAEWTNIIMWDNDFDNGLDGKQYILSEANGREIVKLPIDKSDIRKPEYIVKLSELVSSDKDFKSIVDEISPSKPYGLRPDILKNPDKYGLPPLLDERSNITDIRILTAKGLKYVSHDYPIPRYGDSFDKYKVFIPKAWGNWSKSAGLGGAYADIYLAKPNDACLETYIEAGSFTDEIHSKWFAKYMMTSFVRGLIYMNKYSQNNSRDTYSAVPSQNFVEPWWDKSIEEINDLLFDKYNIPEDIRIKVNANIQLKDESSIVDLGRDE